MNIIYGPSNTGKTYIVKCIDYMFGSDKEPIDISTGYEVIEIIVRTEHGKLIMSRKIGENKINVEVRTKKYLRAGIIQKQVVTIMIILLIQCGYL